MRKRLFGRFGKGKVSSLPDASRLTFDASGWQEKQRSPGRILWTNEAGEVLSAGVAHAEGFPSLSDQADLRRFGRDIAEPKGSIVSVDAFPDGPVPTAQLIYKRQQGTGYVYTGMLFAPSEDAIHVLSLVCGERGETGSREAVVSAKLAQEGRLEFDMFEHPYERGVRGLVKGWFQDPYDPDYPGPILRTVADDETYDQVLPNHPLSRMRRTLSQLRQSARLTP